MYLLYTKPGFLSKKYLNSMRNNSKHQDLGKENSRRGDVKEQVMFIK
jgi:hypothetical protein